MLSPLPFDFDLPTNATFAFVLRDGCHGYFSRLVLSKMCPTREIIACKLLKINKYFLNYDRTYPHTFKHDLSFWDSEGREDGGEIFAMV